uniref:Venom protein n=1 Tax=Ampulex compressa TaxID=860918 RepID=A0A1W6EW15_AMPCP|nr:venom protein [Ampulex compressa]
MLKAAIVLLLLASIYGLEGANAVKKDVNIQPNVFDATETKKDVQKKIGNLVVESVADWRDTQLLLSSMHNNASLLFEMKLKQELEDIRLAVQTAHENGRDASYCIEDAEYTVQAFQQDAELKFCECEAASWKDFTNNYDVITEIIQAGFRALKEIKNIHLRCFRRFFYLSECYAKRTRIARCYVKSFCEKLKFQPTYRRLIFIQMFDKHVICLKTHIKEGMQKVNAYRLISKSCVDGAE